MNHSRTNHSQIEINKLIYIIGGDDTTSCEVYFIHNQELTGINEFP